MDDFHGTFQKIEAIFDGMFFRAQLIWILVGSIIILCGFVLLGLSGVYRIKGRKVVLKVIKLHVEEQLIKDDDDEERIMQKQANPLIRPEFEIMNGPFKGTRTKSSSAGTDHIVGEIVPGYFIPKSGDVTSQREVQKATKYGLVAIAMGAAVIIGTQLIAASWTR